MQPPLLLTGATLIDGVNPNPIQNASILVRNGRITAVGQGAEIGAPDGAQVLDLTGKWVIPGLIEMHTHIREHVVSGTLAAGVTTVRDTGSWLRSLQELRGAAPDAPTPRIIAAGRIIDGLPGMWGPTSPAGLTTDSPQVVREEVRRQAAFGAELIKIYGLVTREMMLAAVEEASAHGLPVSCDFVYQTQLNIRDAARAGVRWNEHASGFLQALYPSWSMRGDEENWAQVPWDAENLPELDLLCEELIHQGLLLCPTLTLWDQGKGPEYWWPPHPVTQYLDRLDGLKQQWAAFPERWFSKFERISRFTQLIARTYKKMGGVVVAGTDAPAGRFTPWGLALHRELQLLVANGWSNMEALQAATSLAAATLNRGDIGRVRPGAWADMVVLSTDPLDDIANTLQNDRVIKGGRIYTPYELTESGPSLEQLMVKQERLMAEYYAGEHPEAPEGPTAKPAQPD